MTEAATAAAPAVPVRFSRQAGILPTEGLFTHRVVVAGVGAVGGQLVRQLVLCGQRDVTFYDHDDVEEANLYPQGWAESDLGKSKAVALNDALLATGRKATINAVPTQVPYDGVEADVMFLCVDSIHTRKLLFEAYKHKVKLIVDTRVAADTIRVLIACDEIGWDYYSSTIFDAKDRFDGGCTTKMTLHHANLAAGLAVQQYSLWMRKIPLMKDILMNLVAMEMSSK
jgi:molybdopterin/thiamine biosynthesis adenylyltransferase